MGKAALRLRLVLRGRIFGCFSAVSYTHLDDVEYKKCLGCSFYFQDLDGVNQESLISLIKNELLDELGMLEDMPSYSLQRDDNKTSSALEFESLDDRDRAVEIPVSYTHLDVYKRQIQKCGLF